MIYEKPYAVWVDADNADPTSDVISESVLEGQYDTREEALLAAVAVSRKERTLATVYDTTRPSAHVKDAPLLIAAYENGRSL